MWSLINFLFVFLIVLHKMPQNMAVGSPNMAVGSDQAKEEDSDSEQSRAVENLANVVNSGVDFETRANRMQNSGIDAMVQKNKKSQAVNVNSDHFTTNVIKPMATVKQNKPREEKQSVSDVNGTAFAEDLRAKATADRMAEFAKMEKDRKEKLDEEKAKEAIFTRDLEAKATNVDRMAKFKENALEREKKLEEEKAKEATLEQELAKRRAKVDSATIDEQRRKKLEEDEKKRTEEKQKNPFGARQWKARAVHRAPIKSGDVPNAKDSTVLLTKNTAVVQSDGHKSAKSNQLAHLTAAQKEALGFDD